MPAINNNIPPLPLENWAQIFSKLEPKDLVHCARVCKEWHAYIKQYNTDLSIKALVQVAIPFDRAKSDKCVALAKEIFQRRGFQIESAAINSKACFLLTRKNDEHGLVRILHSDVTKSQSVNLLKKCPEPLTCLHVWGADTFYCCSKTAVFRIRVRENIENPNEISVTDFSKAYSPNLSISRITPWDATSVLILPTTSFWSKEDTSVLLYNFAQKQGTWIDIPEKNAVDIAVLGSTIYSLHNERRSVSKIACLSLFCVPLCCGNTAVINGTTVAKTKYKIGGWETSKSNTADEIYNRFTSSTNLITFRGDHAYGGLTSDHKHVWTHRIFRKREANEMFSDMVLSYMQPKNYFSGEYHGKSVVAYRKVVEVDDVQIPADFKLDREFRLLSDEAIPFVYLVNDKMVRILLCMDRSEKTKN